MKRLALIAFFVLFLVPAGTLNVFANHTPPGTGTTGHCDIVANPPLAFVDYSNCNLAGVDFSNAVLAAANLQGANLQGANLSDANLNGADFSGADLSGADLSLTSSGGCFFTDANIFGANLSDSSFSNCDFSGANLFNANLDNADFSSVDFTGADLNCMNHEICFQSGPMCGSGTTLIGQECISSVSPGTQCGQGTTEANGFCVPNLSEICGTGTIIDQGMCIATSMGNTIAGELLDIDNYSLFVAAIGVNPVITGLVAVTLAGIAGQIGWAVHKRKKNE